MFEPVQLACTCPTKCQFCLACAHIYSCTCLDAYTNTTVCKHMHLVHMKNKPNNIMDTSAPETQQLDYIESAATISFPLSVVQSGSNLQMKQIEKRIADIQDHCNDCKDTKTLEKVYHLLGTILEQFLHDTDDSPANARKRKLHMTSKTQPHFFSTRKKRKTLERAIEKPSHTETQTTQNMLTNIETDVCGICFSEEDKNSTESHIDWISCVVCDMWVHTTCANNTSHGSSPEYTCLYCS